MNSIVGELLSVTVLCVVGFGVHFSAGSYATVGYGDVALPLKWRMLGPLESIIGVLMCGISVSLVFAMITRLISRDPLPSTAPVEALPQPGTKTL